MTHEFRKLMNLFENENPDVDYEMVGSTKSKTLSGDFSKIIANLSGSTSAKFTKIANKFKELDDLAKETAKLRNQANEEAKVAMEELFEPEHAVLTRIAQTKSVLFQMAKDVESKEVEVESFDLRSFLREAQDLLGKDLYVALRDIYKAHKKIETIVSAGRKGALSIKQLDQKKSVKEDVGMEQVDKISDVVGQLTDARMGIVDRKLDNLKSAYDIN